VETPHRRPGPGPHRTPGRHIHWRLTRRRHHLLRAGGVAASFWDGAAVLIAVATLAQLPTGPAAGAAAAGLILGSQGFAASVAAGVLMTVTGTIGGVLFALWSGGDQLWSFRRDVRRAAGEPPPPGL
jgi:hypothetical protein